jgi:hypothetical protein
MENKIDNENKREIVYKQYDRKKLLTFLIVFLISVSLPGNVKCDMGDTLSSIILFVIISVFVCAGIGWWTRRNESK